MLAHGHRNKTQRTRVNVASRYWSHTRESLRLYMFLNIEMKSAYVNVSLHSQVLKSKAEKMECSHKRANYKPSVRAQTLSLFVVICLLDSGFTKTRLTWSQDGTAT